MSFLLETIAIIIFLSGSLTIFIWQKKKQLQHTSFYLLSWTGIVLAIYSLVLELQLGSCYFLIPLACGGLFAYSYAKDKRKLINGLLFNCFLISFVAYLGVIMFMGQSIFLGGLLVIFGIIALLGLMFGFYGLLIFLYWNGIRVLKKEAFSLANLLTLLLGIGLTCYLLISNYLVRFLPNWAGTLFLVVPFLMLYFFIVFYNFLTISLLYQYNRPKLDQDYIVVLGAGLLDGQRVSPLLARRIDKAIAFYHEQKQATDKKLQLLMSGGQGRDEKVPEAVAMKDYALAQGIPAEDILTEERSTTTLENMRFSKALMDQLTPQPYKVIFTSNNYHIFRAGMYARAAQLKADGLGAKTARYYLPNAFLREFIAIVALKKKRHLVICLLILGFFILMALITFFLVN